MSEKKQMSETYRLGIILAAIGGFLDAYTYISRGGVFANAQTGNIVFLGIYIAQRNWEMVGFYLLPILAFSIGIFIAEIIQKKYKYNEGLHWRQIVLLIEFVTLFIVGFIPAGNLNTLSNILISFVCSLQVKGFRKLNGSAYSTTMCTGNLRSATENLYKYIQKKDKHSLRVSLQYYGIICFFIIGAIVGSLLTHIFFTKAVFFVLLALTAAFSLMFIEEVEKRF